MKSLREALAELEHEQWWAWAETITEEGLTPERIERWKKYMIPYDELDDPVKDYDRVWADKVLEIIKLYNLF